MKFKGYIAIVLVYYPHDVVICSILGLLFYVLSKIPTPAYCLFLCGVVKSMNVQCNVQCLMFKVQCSMFNIQRPLGIVHSFYKFIVQVNLMFSGQSSMCDVNVQCSLLVVQCAMLTFNKL